MPDGVASSLGLLKKAQDVVTIPLDALDVGVLYRKVLSLLSGPFSALESKRGTCRAPLFAL